LTLTSKNIHFTNGEKKALEREEEGWGCPVQPEIKELVGENAINIQQADAQSIRKKGKN